MAARDKANLVPRTLAPPTSNLGFALGLSQKGASHFHHLSFVVRSLPSSAASWGQNAFPSPGLHKVLQAGCHLASCSRYESSLAPVIGLEHLRASSRCLGMLYWQEPTCTGVERGSEALCTSCRTCCKAQPGMQHPPRLHTRLAQDHPVTPIVLSLQENAAKGRPIRA